MNDKLQNLRHSLSHLLAQAVLEHYPNALPTLGPAVDNGFYYDFDFTSSPAKGRSEEGSSISDKDLKKIEKSMRKSISKWKEFTHQEVGAEEAKKIYKDNPYKIELIDEITARAASAEGSDVPKEKITLYTAGGFTDLCRGGHLESPAKEIDPKSFKLDRVAGAYWRGDEKNKMLTRIYGLAFETTEKLAEYEKMIEEAKKRDHRKLGQEMDLFTFSELVGPGLPLWTPRGTLLRDILDNFVWELRSKYGYERVDIPHITKKDLYIKSGHWEKFKDDLFKITTREGHEYAMKPMNCPHHTQIYARKQWSYRDLPQRYASTTKVYRDEQSGELAGLSRVLAITQDDAHVFCRQSQVKDEMAKIWNIIETFYGAIGFVLSYRLSLHNPKQMEKYLGTAEAWTKSENALRELVQENSKTATEAIGEAAFYGPKIDFMAKDSLGREWQVATIQLDSNMPERFDLTCINEKSEKERIVMIHAAIMGSIERYLSVIIEHFAGAFPLWLAPVQVVILPISEEKHGAYATEVFEELKKAGIRVELDNRNESLGKKIRDFKIQKVPYALVIGDKEVEAKNLTVESRNGIKENLTVNELIKKLRQEIADKK